MKAKDSFDAALVRIKQLLVLYDILKDTRRRNIRKDWAISFKTLMKWPKNENILRIDGKNSILILRESNTNKSDRSQYTHEYLAELLRSAIVSIVSSMDKYFHDIIVERCWTLLCKKENDIPKKLKKLEIQLPIVLKAIQKKSKSKNSRPGHIIKKAIQDKIHKFTFQNPDKISESFQLIGLEDYWTKIEKEMNGEFKRDEIKNILWKISKRRNQIVHEADIVRKTKARTVKFREIKYKETNEWIIFIEQFIKATNKVVMKNDQK